MWYDSDGYDSDDGVLPLPREFVLAYNAAQAAAEHAAAAERAAIVRVAAVAADHAATERAATERAAAERAVTERAAAERAERAAATLAAERTANERAAAVAERAVAERAATASVERAAAELSSVARAAKWQDAHFRDRGACGGVCTRVQMCAGDRCHSHRGVRGGRRGLRQRRYMDARAERAVASAYATPCAAVAPSAWVEHCPAHSPAIVCWEEISSSCQRWDTAWWDSAWEAVPLRCRNAE